MRYFYVGICLFAMVTAPGGCGQPQAPTGPQSIRLEQTQIERAVRTTEDVLEQMHFSIEKSDANAGLVRTEPLRGGQFFEFWRKDNVGKFNTLQANLHSIRRTAEVTFEPEGENLRVNCTVLTERLNLPQRQLASRSQTYALFTGSHRSLQTFELESEQREAMIWTDLADDSPLAKSILNRIQTRLAVEGEGNGQ